jgi:hypothetical protein
MEHPVLFNNSYIERRTMEIEEQVSHFSRFSLRALATAIGFFVLVGLVWASGDPWKSKPYQQWDMNDIKKIFGDSPWVKVVQTDVSWKPSTTASSELPSGGDLKSPGQQKSNAGQGQQGQPGSTGQQDQTEPGSPPVIANFFVRWISSRTLREAGYRSSVLDGKLKEDEAEKQLAQNPDTYQLYLGGPDMTPFQSLDEKTLQGDATLMGKKAKQKLTPSKVEFVRSADGKTLQGIVFSFPRQGSDGKPTIPSTEKSAEFSCVVGKVKLQTSFDLSKMEDTKGLDL